MAERAPQSSGASYAAPVPLWQALEDKAAQVAVARQIADVLLDKIGRDLDPLAGAIRRRKADVVEHALHHRLQAPGADILDARIDLHGDLGDRINAVGREFEIDALRLHQRLILLDEARLGLDQDAAEIVFVERRQLDADRQPPLKFG